MIPDISRIEHMIDACEKIMRFTDVTPLRPMIPRTKRRLPSPVTLRFWAAGRLSDELKNLHPEVPWKVATALRNALIHDYIKIEYLELWKTAKDDIPVMCPQLKAILQELHKKDELFSREAKP